MKLRSIGFAWVMIIGCWLFLSSTTARAFALLGPAAPWMQATNALLLEGDIGGPMDVTNEYRWNVPVLTYGFEQSFVDYFGTNGVAAVEAAIKILNDLPPASQLVLTNYPLVVTGTRYNAANLIDLKSETLALLLEHMGLASPTRYIYVIRQWDAGLLTAPSLPLPWYGDDPNTWVFDYIDRMNFDPDTDAESPIVNGSEYSGHVTVNQVLGINMVTSVVVDPLALPNTAVADDYLFSGGFYGGLSRDDVGGLSYLLSTNNINYETLLPGVVALGTNALVNGAWRPGVDKITFVPQPVNSLTGAFLPMTNNYTDVFLTNGVATSQQVARVTSAPDFLFTAKDISPQNPYGFVYDRTGTTNWVNNATMNGNPGGDGPGTIEPPVEISFEKLGLRMYSYVALPGGSDELATDDTVNWGTFDASTNAALVYPQKELETNQTILRLWLSMGPVNNSLNSPLNVQHEFGFSLAGQTGAAFNFQTSSNLSNWITLFSVTNNRSVNFYGVNNPASFQRFYRVIHNSSRIRDPASRSKTDRPWPADSRPFDATLRLPPAWGLAKSSFLRGGSVAGLRRLHL